MLIIIVVKKASNQLLILAGVPGTYDLERGYNPGFIYSSFLEETLQKAARISERVQRIAHILDTNPHHSVLSVLSLLHYKLVYG